MARLFFALRPDPPAREAIAALAREVAGRHGGRPTPAGKIHLTLAFLGDVDPDRIALAREAAQGHRAHAFELSLDRVGSFARQSLAWVASGRVPAELAILHGNLASGLREAGFELERRPFAPHITIARRIEHALAPAGMAAIAWSATEFVLVESDLAAGRYRDLARWALTAPVEGKRAS